MHTNSALMPTKISRATITRHAQKRRAQRGIPEVAIDVIRYFGERSYDGKGGIRCLMTRDVVERLSGAFGRSQKLDALENKYVVLSADDEEVVITTSNLYK